MNSKKYFNNLNFGFQTLAILLILNFYNCTNESVNQSPETIEPPAKVAPSTPKPEYTEQEPAEWEGIMEYHLPRIKIIPKAEKDNIQIKLFGEFTEQHYIERIGIMDENKQDLAGKSLEKMIKPEVTLTLTPIPDNPKIKVYVKCNLHDLWTKPLKPTKEN